MLEASSVQRQSRLTQALEQAAHTGADIDIDRKLDRLEMVALEALPQAAADDRLLRRLFPAVACRVHGPRDACGRSSGR